VVIADQPGHLGRLDVFQAQVTEVHIAERL